MAGCGFEPRSVYPPHFHQVSWKSQEPQLNISGNIWPAVCLKPSKAFSYIEPIVLMNYKWTSANLYPWICILNSKLSSFLPNLYKKYILVAEITGCHPSYVLPSCHGNIIFSWTRKRPGEDYISQPSVGSRMCSELICATSGSNPWKGEHSLLRNPFPSFWLKCRYDGNHLKPFRWGQHLREGEQWDRGSLGHWLRSCHNFMDYLRLQGYVRRK